MWIRPSDGKIVYLYCPVQSCCRNAFWDSTNEVVDHVNRIFGTGIINQANAFEICAVKREEEAASLRPYLSPDGQRTMVDKVKWKRAVTVRKKTNSCQLQIP